MSYAAFPRPQFNRDYALLDIALIPIHSYSKVQLFQNKRFTHNIS